MTPGMSNTTLAKIVHRQRRGILRDLMWSAGLSIGYLAVLITLPL